jgi:hypothetical protein
MVSPKDRSQTTKAQYEAILTDFFRVVPLPTEAPERDRSLEQAIIQSCLSHGIDQKKSIKAAETSATLVEWMYPLHPKEVQLDIALFTAYCIEIEDIGTAFPDDIRNFRRNMMLGKPQKPIFESCLKLLGSLDQHYDGFCSDKFATGMVNFMGCTLLEFDIDGRFESLDKSPKFPNYFRIMTGLAESYTYFVLSNDISSPDALNLLLQAAPEIMDFTDHVNDFLSFYKESIVSTERHNYVYQLAKARCTSTYEVLCGLSEDIKGYIANIQATVSENPTLSQYLNAYLYGFLAFHVQDRRYRFSELNIPTLTTL